MATIFIFLAILQVFNVLAASEAQRMCEDIYPPSNSEIYMAKNNDYYVIYCHSGYSILGKSIVWCIDGKWESSPPTCIENTENVCKELSNPVNGAVECREGPLYAGTICSYRCLDGYNINGVNTRRCMLNLEWSGRDSTCIPKQDTANFCKELSNPENGAIECRKGPMYVGTVCSYSCLDGFRINGVNTRRCMRNLQWSGRDSTCIPEQDLPVDTANVCKDLSNPENGAVECNDGPLYAGTVCSYRCLDGYRINGVNTRRCMLNLRWSGRDSTCIPEQGTPCPAPPPLLNGRVISCSPNMPPTVGKTCNFQCNNGYVLNGPSSLVCRSNGKLTDFNWKESFPECKALPPPPPQSNLDKDENYQEVSQGNNRNGDRNLATNEHHASAFNDNNPCRNDNGGCQQICKFNNGRIQCGCHRGYYLTSDRKSCRANSNRERPRPIYTLHPCQTNNGGCHHTCNIVRGRVQCSCRKGYRLGANGNDCNDIDECRFEHTNKCQHNCINTEGSYSCICQPGYIQIDDYKCEGCRKNSYWSYDENRCVECPTNSYTDSDLKMSADDCICEAGFTGNPKENIPCEDIDECAIGNFGCSEKCVNTPGSAFCSCATGYMLDVDNKTCIDIDECSIKNGGCQGICHNTDGSFSCSCSEGYVTSNKDHYSCDDVDECLENNGGCEQRCVNYLGGFYCACENGYRLDSGLKNCTDIHCMKLPIPHFSTMKCKKDKIVLPDLESYPVGAVCAFTCAKGFKITASSNRVQCGEDGTWDGPLPECKSQQCESLPVPENGEVHPPSCAEEGNSVKQICTFTCLPGYQLKGNPVFRCKNDLTWTVNEIPVCQPVAVKIQPTIKCPKDITVDLLPGEDSHNVTVSEPIINMKSFKVKPNWISVGSPVEFPAGTTNIIFTTSNPDIQRTVRCTTSINVIDKEPPVFLFCPDHIEVEGVGADGIPVIWKDPIAIDNVGIESLESTLEPNSTFTPGTYNVEYIAKDAAGNNARCSFEINIIRTHCSDLVDPAYGESNCMDWMFGKICKPLCDIGYIRHPNDTMFYSCGDAGAWEPSDRISDCLKFIPAVSSTCQQGYELIVDSETSEEICMECPPHTVWSASTNKCEEITQ